MGIIQFIALLFILIVTLFIGMRVGRSVLDETKRWSKLFPAYADVLLLVAMAFTFLRFGSLVLALLVPAAFIVGRYFFPFTFVHAPVSGIVLAAATLLAPVDLAVVGVLFLVMNFLLGIGAKTRSLVRIAYVQAGIALVFMLVLRFVVG